jgi:hypothetical protein
MAKKKKQTSIPRCGVQAPRPWPRTTSKNDIQKKNKSEKRIDYSLENQQIDLGSGITSQGRG